MLYGISAAEAWGIIHLCGGWENEKVIGGKFSSDNIVICFNQENQRWKKLSLLRWIEI